MMPSSARRVSSVLSALHAFFDAQVVVLPHIARQVKII
jgi:hypothetical protein